MMDCSFTAANYASDGKRHLLLCASGSVATIKIPDILQSLSKHSQLSICLILTKSAAFFLGNLNDKSSKLAELHQLPNLNGIFFDEDEWLRPWKRGEAILHIELRRWADIMVIAPLSANTLAKIVNGLADNLLTNVVRAWDTEGKMRDIGGRKRIIVAPAMNTAMWVHPITRKHIKMLDNDWAVHEDSLGRNGDTNQGWFEVLKPTEKLLACGDIGDGAMREWEEIVSVIENRLGLLIST